MSFELDRIIEEFSRDYYDPRDPFAKMEYDKKQRKQFFSFGIVVDNQDPDQRGRIKVSLPMIAKGYISKWIWVTRPFAGENKGLWCLPDLNDQVMIGFIGGDIHQPIMLGGMYTPRHRPPVSDNTDNNIKVVKTKSTYLLIDDTPGEERIEASIKEGQIRIEIDKKGIHVNNELGGIKIDCRKLTMTGGATHWAVEKDINMTVGGDCTLTANTTAAMTAGGTLTVTGGVVDLNGGTGVTAEGKNIAVEGDPVAGMDLHDIQIPTNSGMKTIPMIPHPYIGKLSDGLSADVNINDKPAATEGSISEFSSPGHFPMPPGVKFKSNPDNKGEVTGGCIDSVLINGNPAAVIASTVTTCDDGGQMDQCAILTIGTVVTFPIQFPGQDPEQYRRDGGLPVRVDQPAQMSPANAAYQKQPKSLTNLQWSVTQAQKGEEVTLSCATSGVKDGAGVFFSIYPEGVDPDVAPPVRDIRVNNKGSRAEYTWVATDLRKDGETIPMKYFFTAWTLYCDKEESGIMQVLNPRILDIMWNRKAYFLGEEAELTIKSFELSDTSPTVTIELWEEDETSENDFVLSIDETITKNEMTISIPLQLTEEDMDRITDYGEENLEELVFAPKISLEQEYEDSSKGETFILRTGV